jgi:phosphatidate cytidylyltransferase
LIALLVGLCWLDYHAATPGTYLLPLAVLLSWLGTAELLTMMQRKSAEIHPLPWVVYCGTVLTVLLSGAPAWMPALSSGDNAVGRLGWLAIGLVASLLIAFVGELLRYDGLGHTAGKLALSCFSVTYIGGLMGFLVQLRLLGIERPGNNARLGMLALASTVLIVKLSDTGQYTVGRLLGSRKLAPQISPGTTWEGALGGMLFALLGGWITLWLATELGVMAGHSSILCQNGSRIWNFFLFALVVAAAGIVGDLAESMLKRDVGVKDSSAWLPGFGGILDVLDSLLGAAPVAYLFWVLA